MRGEFRLERLGGGARVGLAVIGAVGDEDDRTRAGLVGKQLVRRFQRVRDRGRPLRGGVADGLGIGRRVDCAERLQRVGGVAASRLGRAVSDDRGVELAGMFAQDGCDGVADRGDLRCAVDAAPHAAGMVQHEDGLVLSVGRARGQLGGGDDAGDRQKPDAPEGGNRFYHRNKASLMADAAAGAIAPRPR